MQALKGMLLGIAIMLFGFGLYFMSPPDQWPRAAGFILPFVGLLIVLISFGKKAEGDPHRRGE